MGAFALTGALPEMLSAALADTPLAGELTLARSLGFFVLGAAVICLAVYLLSAVVLVVSRMRSRAV
jgi:hypothetical protein